MARVVQRIDGKLLHWWRVSESDLPLLRYAFALLEPDGDPFPVATSRSDSSRRSEMLMVQPGRGFELDEEEGVVDA